MSNGLKLKFRVLTYVNFNENLSDKNAVVTLSLTYLNTNY